MRERPRGLRKYRRSLMVTGLSVILFGWCLASAAPSDNERWLKDLHSGHQSTKYASAVAALNAKGAGVKLDQCSACHTPRNWVLNLVAERPKVEDAACRQCHQPAPEESAGTEAASAVGVSWLGKRLRRPAHEGMDFSGKVAGMGLPAGQSLACADCHADHQGKELADARLAEVHGLKGKLPVASRVKVEEKERLRMTQLCLDCHLPTAPGGQATEVLREFIKSHNTGDGFDPPVPDDMVKLINAAAKDAPLDRTTQKKVVDSVLKVVNEQVLFGEKDESLRGCTPGCHGEHTPANNDAEKYELPKTARR